VAITPQSGDAWKRTSRETASTQPMAMDYLKVLLTQRHEELEQILMNPTAVPITERASINAELKHINKALDELVMKAS